MERKLTSIRDSHRQSNGAYFGDFPDWLVAYAIHRDSDALERSNFEELKERFLAVSPENEQWAIETSGHWLVGHIEHVIVAPDSDCERIALEAKEDLEDYPILNEERYGEMEYAEVTANCALAFRDWLRDNDARDSEWGEKSDEIGAYIASYAGDIGDDIREEYWPEKDVIFWGFVRYRLATKHAT